MTYSQLTYEALTALTPEQKWALLTYGVKDDGMSGEVALLLGTRPEGAIERAQAAAELYRAGRVQYVVASGGVCWSYENELLTEAELMARVLQVNGVPKDAIILDNEARTTKENMICGTLAINRTIKFNGISHVIIVTSVNHMQRSLALAKAFLPRKVTVSGYPSYPVGGAETWFCDEDRLRILDHAVTLTKGLVDCKIVEDIEVGDVL